MIDYKKHLKNGIIVAFSLYLVFLMVNFFLGRFDDGITAYYLWTSFWENFVFSMLLFVTNTIWFEYVTRKYKKTLFRPKPLTTAFFGHVVVSMLGIFTAHIIIYVGIHEKDFATVLKGGSAADYLISLTTSIVVVTIFYVIWYYKNRQDRRVKEQKIIAGAASAKFDALKNQLDPHFLFNSLNVLTSLIEEDPYQAQKFTTSLSKVYRYVLEQKNKELVSVDEELRFAKTYVRLLKMRFEDSIVFDIPEMENIPEAHIIPLSLQLLLENAVKHNIVMKTKPLHLKVFAEEGYLVVSNNLQEKQVVKKSSGVGLQNIRQRYELLTDQKVIIDKTASDFQVRIPMLKKQVSAVEGQKNYIEDKRYHKAKERVAAVKSFYGNLFSFCIVIPFLAFLNYKTTSFPWVIFPILGWGYGLAVHGLEAYGIHPLWGKKWEERKLRELMEDEHF